MVKTRRDEEQDEKKQLNATEVTEIQG